MSSSGTRLSSLCTGRMYTRPFPTTVFSNLGVWAILDDITSRCLVFGIHRRSSYPPAFFSLGKDSKISSLKVSFVHDTSGTITFFSPMPAAISFSFTAGVHGAVLTLVEFKHTSLTVQDCPFCFLVLRLVCVSGVLYDAKFARCSLTATPLRI